MLDRVSDVRLPLPHLRTIVILSILLLLPTTLASPFPHAIPTALVVRNHAGPITNESYATITPNSPTPTSLDANIASTTTSSAPATSSTVDQGQTLFSGIPSQLLEWVAVVIVAGVIISSLIARYLFIRRFYPPTFRSYFVPAKGIHLPWIGLHIEGPPPRPQHSYFSAGQRGSGRSRRTRRDRTTTGPGIGEGGRRAGTRDEDDYEEGEVPGAGEHGDLPSYAVDTELPGYDFVDGVTGQAALSRVGAIDAPAPVLATEGDEVVPMPSVQEYEEATRRAHAAVIPMQRPERARIVDGELRRHSTAGESSTSTYLSGADESDSSVKDGKGKATELEGAGEENIEMGEMTRKEDTVVEEQERH